MKQILEAYYEPQFSEHSHGFRQGHGCHTALSEVRTWKGTKWFIEGDISKCFDTIDHNILIAILGKSIKDNRFLRLVKNMLDAGYLEDWKYNKALSGTPQGGIVSPILANIYMNEFDEWSENELLHSHNTGNRQKSNPEYNKFSREIAKCYENGEKEAAKKLKIERRNIPSVNTYDESYRRLRFVRYADDFILGFTSSKAEAENIKAQLAEFLGSKLKLTLSEEKTLITNATTDPARFLNYNLKAQRANDYIDPTGRRGANGVIGLFVPADVVEAKCRAYMKKSKTIHIGKLINDDDFSIIETFQQQCRGIVQYYLMAQNVCWFGRLHWIMEGSLLKTLACKYRSSMKKMKKKYQSETKDERTGKTLKCLKKVVEREGKKALVAQWGGISLSYDTRKLLRYGA
jgi:group II intron reverse transcriptase/maturase